MLEKKITYSESIINLKYQYTVYINSHIRNVIKAYTNAKYVFRVLFPEVFNSSKLEELNKNLANHDKSKFDDVEFYNYGAKFFPIEGTDPESEIIKENFKIAWLHHLHNNPHHPGYWVLYENDKVEILDMPDIYIIEMLCDWMAMSEYYKTSTLDYWNSDSAQNLPMSPYTKSKVNEFMIEMDKYSKENKVSRW
jgi:hypothetical protein